MNKLISILIGLIAISNIIYSFWKNPESETLFFIDMNTWIYRIIWVLILIGISYDFFKKNKTKV